LGADLRRLILATAWNGPADLPAALRLEWRFVAVRWLGILFMTPGIHMAGFSAEQMNAAYLVLAIAAVYNIALQVIVPRRPTWFINGYVTALGDALLNACMVGLAGGFDSPLYYILFTVTISAAMRYGYGPALGMASIFVALDAAEQMPRVLLAGPFLFRSGFLLMTAVLAGYLREQARSAETALHRRLEQANLFNEVTATLTATLEADATLRAVAASARLLLGGRCAVLQPAADFVGHGADPSRITHDGTGGCAAPHAELLALCAEYAARRPDRTLQPTLIETEAHSGARAFVLVLARPGHPAPLGVIAVQVAPGVPTVARDIMESFIERCALALENVLLFRSRTDLYEEVRRQADALRENETELRAVLSNVAEGIITVAEDGRIASLNRAAEWVFGYRAEELLGQPADTLFVEVADARDLLSDGWRTTGTRPDSAQREASGRRRDGSHFPMDIAISNMAVDTHKQFIMCVRDITERKQAEAALEHQALHDLLTGLPNRVLLHDRLGQALVTARQSGEPLALLILDLDRFKDVNDTFGHHAGDQLLRQIGPRLQMALRKVDTLSRLGGDEFALVLPNATPAVATHVATRLLEILEAPFEVDEQAVAVGASIGIAVSPEHGPDAETLLRRADVAMYVAKRAGGGFALYSAEHDGHSSTRLALFGELRAAIERNELLLHYQPKVACDTGATEGVEALVRWNHPQRGLVQPDEFIPLAEQTGLIKPLSLWVLNAALLQLRAWRESGLNVPVAVNLSMLNLHDPQLPEIIGDLLRRHGVPAGELTVELTESHLMADPARALDIVTRLCAMGVRLAVDDFGTGYSSLAYLKRLPVSELKIDRSFVRQLVTDEDDAAIVRSTISLGHDLGLSVVAEGVEDQATWDQLRTLDCDVIQGFHVSRPVPAEQITRWVRQQPGDTFRFGQLDRAA
jgi:diguanylate cyclase (GGDEF)-like protein/PAS domain S-box-containing protein